MLAGACVANSGEITTGIEAFQSQHCWYDNTHVIILLQTRLPDLRDQTEGLFILDVTKPHELTRLDLAPLSSDVQHELTGLSCQDQSIVFYRFLPGRQIREFYTMALYRPPERLAELRGALVSLRGRYLLGNSAKMISDGGPFQGTFEGNDDCDVRYVRPGFRVICWDSFQYINRPLTRFVLSKYQWQKSIKVRADQGTKYVPNPAQPLMGKDGKPIFDGLYLRDLNGQIVATLSDDPKYRPSVVAPAITPDENYIYAPCHERTRRTEEDIAVCRYRLDGDPHAWEEVFRIDTVKKFKFGIPMISVSNSGDVYFSGATPHLSIWKFEPTTRNLEPLTSPQNYYLDENPSVSPNGRWILFVRSGKDGAKLMLLQGGAR
jgi:hypothetical protein